MPRTFQHPHRARQLALLLAVLGPGIITANVDNDAGGISTYSVTGSKYGFTLLCGYSAAHFADPRNAQLLALQRRLQ